MTNYRTALVTGASSGIGRAICLALAREGTIVYAAARRDDLLQTLAKEAKGITPVVLDVSDCDAAVARIKALDAEAAFELVIANAGASPRHDDPPAAWETLKAPCHTNFCGAVATLTAALPAMLARKRGHLVGISSLASFGSLPQSAAYASPKAGLSMFLRCLRLDLRGSGVSVTSVHPGFVATPHVASSTHPLPQMMSEASAAEIIVRRLKTKPARIDFPQPLAWITRAFAAMPEWLRALLLRATVRTP